MQNIHADAVPKTSDKLSSRQRHLNGVAAERGVAVRPHLIRINCDRKDRGMGTAA